jgi:DNA-binding response OmpR family regulator
MTEIRCRQVAGSGLAAWRPVGPAGKERQLEQSSKRVLIVDDDAEICTLITDILEEDGYDICPCLHGDEALNVLKREHFDLVLTDIKMPRVTGIDLLLHVRRMDLETEVILMTAYASLQTAIQALRGEAFDYLIKPISLSELRQRVRQAVSARPSAARRHAVMHCHDLSIDNNARRVWKGEREIKLTRLEFDVLAYLFGHQGCAVSRQRLLQEVWGRSPSSQRSVATVRSCIRRLRRKIEDDADNPRYIYNVWGVGYQLGD